MIEKITKLKNIGIFNSFTAADNLANFRKFNLFYGWNGSGKTTLSRFLNAIQLKDLASKFENAEYEIVLKEGKITHKAIPILPFPIFTFNQEFINNNIDWNNNGAKSIVVISESKIDERKRYLILKDKEIPRQKDICKNALDTLNASNKEIDTFLTTGAKSIKQSFQVIDTGDSYYVNYDKRKLKNCIDNNLDKISHNETILADDELAILHQKVKPIEKTLLEDKYSLLKVEQITQAKSKIDALLQLSLIDTSLKRLNDNVDINDWVRVGFYLHKTHGSSRCEYCGEVLSEKRISELNNHFNDVYLETVEKIRTAITWLSDLLEEIDFHSKGLLFDELGIEYSKIIDAVKCRHGELKAGIDIWKQNLERKASNPFFSDFEIQSELDEKVVALNDSISILKSLLKKHNDKVLGFDEQLKTAKSQLELHYVADSIKEKDYFNVLKRINEEIEYQKTEEKKLEVITQEFLNLEAILSDAALAANEFNENLHKFLGRKEVTLKYDSQQKGFKIYRGEELRPANNLSEGEKTAIAFTYFITKLGENGNELKNSVLVIDDPISSFDSNHLYHSFACLRDICEKAKQSFILTHNFQYFKLVRDWMKRKNIGKEKDKFSAMFYGIESTKVAPRASIIVNCHDTLLNYGSEYQFIYLKLKEYRASTALDLVSACLVANMARKILETFLSFKFPKGRNNFRDLLESGHNDRILTEKIYRFINKYSHVDGYDIETGSIDNLLGEGGNIVDDIFRIIEEKDADHYAEMESISV